MLLAKQHMGQHELDALWSLNDKITDEFLRSYAKRIVNSFPPGSERRTLRSYIRGSNKINRKTFYRILSLQNHPDIAWIFPDFISRLKFDLDIKPQFIQHGKYQTRTSGRSLTAKEIVDTFSLGKDKILDLLGKISGGEFCRGMTELKDEKVLGVGSYGSVFAVDNEIHKMFNVGVDGRTNSRGNDPLQEIVLLSFVTTFAVEENNPHFVTLKELNVCPREFEKGPQYPYMFMTLTPITATLGELFVYMNPSSDVCHSLFFQYLRACQFLINHGIVHFDMHQSNLAFEFTTIDYIDYDDGWSAPTHGAMGKIIDFGRSDRYISPEYRTRFVGRGQILPYDTFNPANDPLTIIFTFRKMLEATGRMRRNDILTEAVHRAIQFCEEEFDNKLDNLVGKGSHGYVAKVHTDDLTFLQRLTETVFPEYRR